MNKDKYEFFCDKDDVRVDLYLSDNLRNFSRSYIQKLIQDGHIKINGRMLYVKKTKLKLGDHIEIDLPEPELLNVIPQNIPITIVYEDNDVIIVDKPQGMVVHPAPGHSDGTLVNALMYHIDNLSGINGVIRPGIVHRIDKDTSGLLMVAKNDHAHECLAAQLKDKSSERVYYAIVNGVVKKDTGKVDAPIGRHPSDRKKMAIIASGREAVTHFEVIDRYNCHTLLKLKLETGRTHQIRVHLASIGFPILGDVSYGLKNEKIKHDGQALHAKTLGFIHPTTNEWIYFDSELPEYFTTLIKKCKGL